MGEENIYSGAGSSLSPSYGIDEGYGDSFFGNDYRSPTSSFAVTTDPRSANKLKEVSAKLNTGASTVEITALQPELWESLPTQHLEELNRLRKIVGADLTLHGPLIEASGISREGMDESRRMQAENQMWETIKRANKLDPKGNLVVTFHTTSGLPEMISRNKMGGEEVTTEILAIDERGGQIVPIKPKINYLEGEKEANPFNEIKNVNKERWLSQLSQTSFHAHQGRDIIEKSVNIGEKLKKLEGEIPGDLKADSVENTMLEFYKKSNTEEGQKYINALTPNVREFVNDSIKNLNYGDIYARDAYSELQGLFGQAWEALNKNPSKNKEEIKKLSAYQKEMKDVLDEYQKDKIMQLPQFANKVMDGIKVLSTIKEVPETIRPLQDYVLEKSSQTISNVAFKAYNEFEKNGKGAPIISLENPPIGMGIGRAEDMVKLIEESRKKLVEKIVEKDGLNKDDAKKQADKLIGATWDVGHINMMKQFGYTDKDILKETEKIAKYVNKIHLSDNFGMEHTELPMGMGNVPMKGHMAKLKEQHGDKLDKIKKIIEAANWYQHFQTSPFTKTLQSFGSPIYGMQMAPYWNQTPGMNSTTYSGYGMMLPDQHFSMYGSGFSGMPQELGGQVAGRSRLSGNAME